MNFPRLVLAGSHSGSGKTTLSLGLMAALVRRGLTVQPFKVGPDYIDPAFHTFVTGNASRNLDAWLLPEATLQRLFHRHAPADGVSVIEGVMGLYDGLGTSALASTAHVASLLKAPTLLVVNAEGLSLSAAALVSGYANFRPRPDGGAPRLGNLAIGGVILNRVSGAKHYDLLCRCIEEQCGIRCLGFLPKNAVPPLPRRHLGLVPAEEQPDLARHMALLADAVERHIDLEALIGLARTAPPLEVPPPDGANSAALIFAPGGAEPPAFHDADTSAFRPRIGIARDRAFSFYYQDNLDLLEALGAELVFCSPLHDAALPDDLDGLYLGGGFPEIFAAELEANQSFRADLLGALEGGLPALAECGGLLYLCAALLPVAEPGEGAHRAYAMTGFFPHIAAMTGRLQPFGYVTVTLKRDCLLGPAGSRFRAHEFHYSRLLECDAFPADALSVRKEDGRTWMDGLSRGQVLGCYPHLHFHGCPAIARSFVNACREYRASQRPTPKG